MSDTTSGKLPSALLTPQHISNGQDEEKSNTVSVRRPRNREVMSRYKSSSTQVSLSRRYANGSGDRLPNASDLPSPKWSDSSEKNYHSPSWSTESRVSNTFCDVQCKNNSDGIVPPKLPSARIDPLWPPSSRVHPTSMHCKSHSQPLKNASNEKNVHESKDSSSLMDQALRPMLNTEKRRPPEPKFTVSPYQNSDQAENAQPPQNLVKSDMIRCPGSNIKMCGTALSKSVDLSVERGRSHTKVSAWMMAANPIYGSSRAPRPLSSSRALSYTINEGQGLAMEQSKSAQALYPLSSSQTISHSTTEEQGCVMESQKPKLDIKVRKDVPIVTFVNKSFTNSAAEQQGSLCSSELQGFAREEAGLSSTSCSTGSTCNQASDLDSLQCPQRDQLCKGATMSATDVRMLKGSTVPARFWQDATSRAVRTSQKAIMRSSMLECDLSVANSRRPGIKPSTPRSPEAHSDCNLSFNEAPSPPWTTLVSYRPAILSTSRTSSYNRSTPSPGRSRVSTPSMPVQGQRPSSATTMLTFGIDTYKRGKRGLAQIDDAHLHRTLHNRLLQWRFVNAKAAAALDGQSSAAQKSLYNTCAKMFELRASTTSKKIQLGQGRQVNKLSALVIAQAPVLHAWSDLQQDHNLALKGTVQALESAIIRVPVSGAVKADTYAVKEALHSALDVMNSAENSVNYLAPKAEDTYALMSELARVVALERKLLEECADLVAAASVLQMEECSLRAHIVQMERERTGRVAVVVPV